MKICQSGTICIIAAGAIMAVFCLILTIRDAMKPQEPEE